MRFSTHISPFSFLFTKKYLLILLIFFALKLANAQTISSTTVNKTHFCIGGTYTVTFTTSIGFPPSTFRAKLSNSSGSFVSPDTIIVGSSGTNSITITIPSGTTLSNNYRLVVNSSTTLVTCDTLSNLTLTKPSPSFTFTNFPCAGTNVSFTNTSIGNGVGISNYSWDFSATAGSPSSPNTNTSPTVSFNPASGSGNVNYLVVLTATDSFGCVNTANNSIEIRKKPTPSFIFNNNPCAGTNVNFTNTSIGNSAFTCSYSFTTTPSGAPANINNNCTPTVQFNPALGGGIIPYPVTLTVTDVFGCVSDTIINIGVKQRPDFYLDTNVIQSSNGVEWDPILKIYSNCFSTPTNSTFTFSDSLFSSTFLSNNNIVINICHEAQKKAHTLMKNF